MSPARLSTLALECMTISENNINMIKSRKKEEIMPKKKKKNKSEIGSKEKHPLENALEYMKKGENENANKIIRDFVKETPEITDELSEFMENMKNDNK